MQVGQTGARSTKVTSPAASPLVQHFAGMKSAGMIIAINTDPNAPSAKSGHYAVADLFDVLLNCRDGWRVMPRRRDHFGP
jgi:electron transfer flavoprotein alpha subunit